MRRNRRLAVVALSAAAVAAALAAVVVTAPVASAATFGTFVTSNNSSDPHIINCTDPSTNTAGYCLYTSQDMGQQYSYPRSNYYPMKDTLVYFSPNGFSSWTYKGVAFTESQLDSWAARRTGTGTTANDHDSCTNSHSDGKHKPFAPDTAGNCRAYHLWAPSAIRMGNNYWLYVPDVTHTGNGPTTPNIHTSSRIAVARSTTGPFGPFTYQGTVTDSAGNYPGYMSDPDIVVDGDNRYLIWADGDYSNCGGFKSAKLSADMTHMLDGTIQTLTINGLDHARAGLGVCGSTGRPYLEGASIYKRSFNPTRGWTLIFPAKPQDGVIPKECNADNAAPGTAQNDRSVIAWASATSAQGPYQYEGLIMCGSLHEWTNQATLTVTTGGRLEIIFHDANDGNKNRKLQAECLWYGSGHIAAVYRQAQDAPNGFQKCVTNNEDTAYRGLWGYDPQQPTKARIMSANGAEVIAKRYAVGPWERFKFELVATGIYVIRSLQNGKLLCSPNTSTPLTPTCTSSGDLTARFEYQSIFSGFGHFNLKSQQTGRWVGIAGNGRLYPSATVLGDAATFAQLSYMSPWSSLI